MVILTFIAVVLGVSSFMIQKTLSKELSFARKMYGKDYTMSDLIVDKFEYMLCF